MPWDVGEDVDLLEVDGLPVVDDSDWVHYCMQCNSSLEQLVTPLVSSVEPLSLTRQGVSLLLQPWMEVVQAWSEVRSDGFDGALFDPELGFMGVIERAEELHGSSSTELAASEDARRQLKQCADPSGASGYDGLNRRIAEDAKRARKFGLSALLQSRVEEHARERLQVDESTPELSGFAQADVLVKLAREGAEVLLPCDFIPDKFGEPLRDKFWRLMPAPILLCAKEVESGDAVVLPIEVLKECVEKESLPLNLACYHWVPKRDDSLGRPIYDYSGCRAPLNGQYVTLAYAERFGCLQHPTLCDVLRMIADAGARWGLRNVCLGKKDVSRAFRRWHYRITDCALLAVRIFDNMALVPIGGVFGHSGSPFVQGVISRFLIHCHERRAGGESSSFLRVYVDDLMLAAPRDVLGAEMNALNRDLETFIGQGADALHKECGPARSLVFLGWQIDLDQELLLPTESAVLKLVYVLWRLLPLDLTQPVRVRVLQSAAGVLCRYALILPGMRQFVWALFHQAPKDSECRVSLTARAVAELWLWRAVLIVAHARPRLFGVSLFAPLCAQAPQCLPQDWCWCEVYVDACRSAALAAIGVYIPQAPDRSVVSWLFMEWDPSWGQPPHINVLELLALVFGFLLARQLHQRARVVKIFTDNRTAFSWAAARRFKRQSLPLAYALASLNVFAQLLPHHLLQVRVAISSEENFIADSISRANFGEVKGRDSDCSRFQVGSRLRNWLGAVVAGGSSTQPLALLRDVLTMLDVRSSNPFFERFCE